MRSPIYWHPALFHFAMKLLYGKHFEIRYSNIGAIIPEGATVTEVCMGDAYLYRNYLLRKKVRYTGLDMNETFVKSAQKKNICVKIHNLLSDEIPAADYIIIQASLYQFIPHHHFVIKKLLDAVKKELIISEPVINSADSSNSIISFIAKYAGNPGSGHVPYRFNRQTFMECLNTYKGPYEVTTIENGLEILGILRKKR